MRRTKEGAYYEWRWEVHRILFGQLVLLLVVGVAPFAAPYSKNSIPRNSDHKFGERKKCYFFVLRLILTIKHYLAECFYLCVLATHH